MKLGKLSIATTAAFIVLMIVSSGCKNDNDVTAPDMGSGGLSVQAMMKVVDNSPSVNSFTPNYNEDGAMTITDSTGQTIYPVKVGQRLHLVDRQLTVTKDSMDTSDSTNVDSTATGTLVQKYEGELIIAGSFQQPDSGKYATVDTVIHKPFSTTITRIITFKKVDTTGTQWKDWRITGISLPAGGTGGDNVTIDKMTLTAEDGTSVEINDPNSYFFNVGNEKYGDDDNDGYHFGFDNNMQLGKTDWHHHWGWKFMFMIFRRHQKLNISLEVLSKSADKDFITITHGASMSGGSRMKSKFGLVSSVKEGDYYRKTYEGKWYTNSSACRTHAVINVLPGSTVSDTTNANVEEKTWGIPYKIY